SKKTSVPVEQRLQLAFSGPLEHGLAHQLRDAEGVGALLGGFQGPSRDVHRVQDELEIRLSTPESRYDGIDLRSVAAAEDGHAQRAAGRPACQPAQQFELRAVPEEIGAQVLPPIGGTANESIHRAAISGGWSKIGEVSGQPLPEPLAQAKVHRRR